MQERRGGLQYGLDGVRRQHYARRPHQVDGHRERYGRPVTRGHRNAGRKKKLGIFDILGIAVGNIGLSYNDFCALTPEEFSHIYKAYSEERTAQYQDSWERMRMLAAITIQPYAKKGLTPHGLLPFPWEKKKPEHTKAAPAVSKEDALKRFEEVLGKVGNG